MTQSAHRYDEAACASVYRVIGERRDVRHFLSTPVDPEILIRLFAAAHAAPSVGLSQPWRFVRITQASLRQQLYELVQQERLRALGQMASGVAHDVNNALSPIVAYSELLLATQPDLPDTTRQY